TGWSRSASACLTGRAASRLALSIARRRAVVMIHPAGLGGTPSPGHRSTAVEKASCTASSARSISPRTRVSTATARPYSSRKTRPMSAVEGPVIEVCTSSGAGSERQGPHLDGQCGGVGETARPLQRLVEVGHVDHVEATEMLLALDVRTVGRHRVPLVRAHDRRRVRWVQAAGEHPDPCLLDLVLPRLNLLHDR